MKSMFVVLLLVGVVVPCFGNIVNRIVGGQFAEKNQFPYHVSLKVNGNHNCGGSIISNGFILTAAHCVTYPGGMEQLPREMLSIHAGSIYINKTEGEFRNVARIIVHPNYKGYKDDVAIIELDEDLEYSESIQPIELCTDEVPEKEPLVISGWGRIYHNGPPSNILKYNIIKTMDSDLCGLLLRTDYEGLMCGGHSYNNGACSGDSGGPAAYQGKLAGVIDFVVSYCGTENPDGYAKVSYYADWIKKTASL